MVYHNLCHAHPLKVGVMQIQVDHVGGTTFGRESRSLIVTWSHD